MADIELTADDGNAFTAHRAEPEGPPRGGVVVIQEIFGVNAHIRSVADRFAAAGYLALAPALFDRLEPGVELGYDEEGMVRGADLAWERLSIDSAILDLRATAAALAEEVGGPSKVATVGFCFGGMLSAATASRAPEHLGAAVAYYPSLASEKLVGDVPAVPLLVLLGDQDQRVTVEDGHVLAERWPDAEFVRYPDAGHGFNCDLRASYDAEAAADAWRRTLTFLDTHLA